VRTVSDILVRQQRFVDRYDEAVTLLRRLPGVLSVGVGARERGGEIVPELAFRVYVAAKVDAARLPPSHRVPPKVCGLPTDVLVKPDIHLIANWDSAKYRPLQGGTQVRNDKFEGDNTRGAGTIGCLAQMSDGSIVALTAQHIACAGTPYAVGAGSGGGTGFACVGVKAGQPRHITCCCCCTFNEIGAVLRAENTAQLDCATIKLDPDIASEVTSAGTLNQVLDIGILTGVAQAVCFSEVRKRGAATGLTRGTVVDVLFEGSQILINPLVAFPKFADYGDSGAVIVDAAGKVVGLLHGADRATGTRGVANHIGPVLVATGITIAGDAGAGLGIPASSCGSSSSGPVGPPPSSSSSSTVSRSSSSRISSSSSQSRVASSSSSARSSSSSSSRSSSSSFTCPTVMPSVDPSDPRTHLIPSTLGAAGAIHFCTARGAGNMVLRAAIAPDVPDASITWEAIGGAITSPGVGADRHTAKISRAAATHLQVRIRINGVICRRCHVWVVSATGSVTARRPIAPSVNAARTHITAGFDFSFAIQPPTIISTAPGADIPDLRGANTNPPPNVSVGDLDVPNSANSLAGGANHKWDVSRRIRWRVNNPAGLVDPTAGDFWVSHLNYPSDAVVGNDDAGATDETNDPYANGGNITSKDDPSEFLLQALGVNGNTFDERNHFGEFARVELDGHWYSISDYYNWRVHFEFIKAAGAWANNGSVVAEDNAGF